MSFYTHPQSLPQRFRLVLASFLQHSGLPFANVLDADHIQRTFEQEQASFGEAENTIYTPAITLWAFLSQMLHKGEQRSCTAAVARVITLLVASGAKACSEDTGAYCRARAKLSESVLARLTREISESCESQLPEKWLWHGRHVHLVDGTTLSMHDTEHARHAKEPGRLSATQIATGRARLSDCTNGGGVVAGHGDDKRHGHGAVCWKRNGGNGFVS